jgi:hypothetical protein
MTIASLKYSFSIPETLVSVGFLDQTDPTPLSRETLEFALEEDVDAVPDGGRLLRSYEENLAGRERLRGVLLFPFREDEPLGERELRWHVSPPKAAEVREAEKEFLQECHVGVKRELRGRLGREPELWEVRARASELTRTLLINERYLFAPKVKQKNRPPRLLDEILREDGVEAYLPRPDPDEPGCIIPLSPLEEVRTRLKYVPTNDGIYIPVGYAEGLERAGGVGFLRPEWRKLFFIPMEEYRSALRAYVKHSVHTVPLLERIALEQGL